MYMKFLQRSEYGNNSANIFQGEFPEKPDILQELSLKMFKTEVWLQTGQLYK